MKIGYALGGGVAYGFAHIGVLRALERHGIKPDAIAGTSVGAIIGGLYASGLTVEQIEEIALNIKWSEIAKFVVPNEGLLDLAGLERFLLKHLLVKNVEDTPIKFSAVATDITGATEIVYDKGPLEKAIHASCCIPGIFVPMKNGKDIIVDGGVINNVPVSVVKNMGVDFIIGVDVTQKAIFDHKGKGDIFDILWRSMQLMMKENSALRGDANDVNVDIMIAPEVQGINPFDLSKKRELIKRGDEEIEKQIGIIMEKLENEKSILGKIKDILTQKIL